MMKKTKWIDLWKAKLNEQKNYKRYRKSTVKDRFSFDDFLYYRMQNMTEAERNEILTVEELEAYEKVLNDDTFRDVFNDKRKFYARFKAYVHREYYEIEKLSLEEFEKFLQREGRLIVKPPCLFAGQGVRLLRAEAFFRNSAREKEFSLYQEQHMLVEAYVEQKESYQAVYAGGLNTVRLTTFVQKNGTPILLAAANQFGSGGSIVDNDDLTGIWAVTDLESGIVTDAEINSYTGEVMEYHPDTGARILGFHNEDFALMREVVYRAAMEIPSCRLIGWDVCVTKDGKVEIIEGNVTPEMDLFQKITGRGFRSFYEANV